MHLSTPVTIFIDNKASIQASSNPKTRNPIAREIFTSLIQNAQIKLHWIKAHVGYFGNESAYQLAKAESEIHPSQIKYSKAFLKSFLFNNLIKEWQKHWDAVTAGRTVHNIIPKVSFQPVCWTREEIHFFTHHGPFPSYLHRFKIAPSSNCSCGQDGTPLHFATECPLTLSWHITKPSVGLHKLWFRRVASNSGSRTLIRKIVFHINCNQDQTS
ncbi:hypothetical protein AVEN_101232-1 [Araneus ventricosus]|uniref:RNase H type-1 domain-containing protein n=1 Tax=Araneus ventricosus TaxID=182803 RepID=A0A4Y2KRA5_ARAVE|nr:hypothetical protein AVEN_101232-1 [Araneus ventricosus]